MSTVDSKAVEISGTIYQYTSSGVFNGSDSETPGKMSFEIPAYPEALKTYTVTYDANGGTDAPESQIKTEGTELILSLKKPVRNGYTFKGWSDSPSSKSVQYHIGDSYTENADKTLYAVWSEIYFTITTNANGGHFKDGSSFKNLNYREGDNVYPENFDIPEREGYVFAGWLGTTTSANSASDAPNSITIISNKTYYAVWRKANTGTVYINGCDIISGTEENSLFFSEDQKEQVITLVIERVNHIGSSAFANYPNLENVILFSKNSEISDNAFSDCPQLETVIVFGNTNFNYAAFTDCSENIRTFVNAAYEYPVADGMIFYEFKDGVLEFTGKVKFDRYEFFDTVATFCMEYDNIEKLRFSSLEFEDFGLYYYPDEDGEPIPIEGNALDDGEITVYITENGESKEISFNELIKGIEDGSVTDFILSATDKTHGKAKDTVFEIIQKALQKALKWVVSLMNKVFKLIGKNKKLDFCRQP